MNPPLEIRFGPWARLRGFRIGPIAVEPLEDAQNTLRSIHAHPRFSNGWIYPPLVTASNDTRPQAPLVPTTAYTLPPTHRILLSHPLDSDEAGDFCIAVIGMIDGVRLTREGWTHFYKAPIKLHELVDIVPGPAEVAEVVRVGAEYWVAAPPDIRSRLFGAVHWMLFSQLYQHDFERFGGAYTVLDTIYWIHRALGAFGQLTHAKRPQALASHFGMPVPSWAIDTGGSTPIATLRNALVHEARYADAPIGFSHPDQHPSITLELNHFLARLILATLGLPCGYLYTPVDTFQMHGLDIVGPLAAV